MHAVGGLGRGDDAGPEPHLAARPPTPARRARGRRRCSRRSRCSPPTARRRRRRAARARGRRPCRPAARGPRWRRARSASRCRPATWSGVGRDDELAGDLDVDPVLAGVLGHAALTGHRHARLEAARRVVEAGVDHARVPAGLVHGDGLLLLDAPSRGARRRVRRAATARPTIPAPTTTTCTASPDPRHRRPCAQASGRVSAAARRLAAHPGSDGSGAVVLRRRARAPTMRRTHGPHRPPARPARRPGRRRRGGARPRPRRARRRRPRRRASAAARRAGVGAARSSS